MLVLIQCILTALLLLVQQKSWTRYHILNHIECVAMFPHLQTILGVWRCSHTLNHIRCVVMLPHLEPYWVCGHSPFFIYQQTLNGWCGQSLWPSLLSRTLVVPTSNLKLSEKHEIVDPTETWNHETIWPESDTEHETAKAPGLWKKWNHLDSMKSWNHVNNMNSWNHLKLKKKKEQQ